MQHACASSHLVCCAAVIFVSLSQRKQPSALSWLVITNCTDLYKHHIESELYCCIQTSCSTQSLYKKFRVVWSPKIPYRAHKSPPLVPILGHIMWVTTITPCVFKIHFNIVLLFWCTSPSRFLLLSSTETVRIFMSAVRYPRHQVLPHLVTLTVTL